MAQWMLLHNSERLVRVFVAHVMKSLIFMFGENLEMEAMQLAWHSKQY